MSDCKKISSDLYRNIGCVIMASGEGRRFGENKLMADLCGKPLISYVIDTAKNVFRNIVVITRHEDVAQLCQNSNIEVILHSYPDKNDTVRLGVEKFADMCDGCIFCQGDQPLITENTLRKMAGVFCENTDKIIRLEFEGVPSSPVIFPQSTFGQWRALPQGKGGNVIAKNNPDKVIFVTASDRYETMDIDTKEDLYHIETILNKITGV